MGYDGGPEQCLEGGCCGVACDPLVVCLNQDDCEPGQYCDHRGYCQDGCREDEHCQHLWPQDIEDGLDFSDQICWQFQCQQGCSSNFDCNKGGTCDDDLACADDETCLNGYCVKDPADWSEQCNEATTAKASPRRRAERQRLRPTAAPMTTGTKPHAWALLRRVQQGCRSKRLRQRGSVHQKACKTPCTSAQDCKNKNSNTCQGDPNARSSANTRWQKCLNALQL